MDFEFTECLNPVIATYRSDVPSFFRSTVKDYNNKIVILGNLKTLSKKHNNLFIKNLLSQDTIFRLPCRQCINCSMKKAREWSVRNCLEARDFDISQKWFITLTYDDDSAVRSNKIMTLSRSDVTRFMKNLRAKFPKDKIRFFASGEYGSKTLRPHYHIILYGASFKNSDFEWLYDKKSGDKTFHYYRCNPIQESWQKGITVTCNFDDAEAFYVSQYTTKKLNNYKNPYYYLKEKNILPEFVQMSRRPGIAGNYYAKHKDEFYIKYNDKLIFHTDYKTVHIKPFAYFDRLFDLENPDMMQFFKENRKAFGQTYDFFKNYDFNVPIYKFLGDVDRNLKNKMKGENGFENIT